MKNFFTAMIAASAEYQTKTCSLHTDPESGHRAEQEPRQPFDDLVEWFSTLTSDIQREDIETRPAVRSSIAIRER